MCLEGNAGYVKIDSKRYNNKNMIMMGWILSLIASFKHVPAARPFLNSSESRA